ncbi:MAG: ATP-binding protein [Cellvibrionaceae bacterium]
MKNTSKAINRSSIQQKLTFALGLMLVLVVLSAFIAWLAFDRINAGQKVLLSDSLPAMRLVDGAIEDGRELLAMGTEVYNASSINELEQLRLKATLLFDKINQDNSDLDDSNVAVVNIPFLKEKTQNLVSTIQQQFDVKTTILQVTSLLDQEVGKELNFLDEILIDIKLIANRLSLQDLRSRNTDINNQQKLSSLVELRFNVLQLKVLAEGVQYLSSVSQIKKNKNDYRVILNKISRGMFEFGPESRRALSVGMSKINNNLSAENNIFNLAVKREEKRAELLAVQASSVEVSKELSDFYQEIGFKTNFALDEQAHSILYITQSSKVVLILTVLFSLLIVFLFSLLFIKPRLVNRLTTLADNTRSIASNQYDIDIDLNGNDEISDMASSLAYFRDELLEKQGVQKRLEDREKALSTIFNNTVEGLFTVDLNGIIRTFNPACEVFFDAKADETIGRHVSCLLPEDVDVFASHQFKSIEEDGEGYVVCQEKDVLVHDNHGKTFFGRLSISLLNLSGQQAYSCFLRDVSSEHEARERIDTLIEQLMQSNSDLEQFAYSCSHDLQEPVRMVLSFSELLEKNIKHDLDEQSAKYLDYIRQGAKNAKQLIKDMLEYSRLDQSNAVKEWVALGELCEQVQELTMVSRSEYGGVFEWRNSDTDLYIIPSQMVQLLTNLVTNGLKYNESEEKYVMLECEEQENQWLLSVRDNGIGIDSRYNKKIFEVFSRLVSKRKYEGSGIGLSICQKVAEKHGGNIWVESELGKGSQFFISLPKDNEE